MATLIRIMRIATLTFALTALVFVLLSLLSGWLPVPDVDAFGIWAPLTIFLTCLVTSVWLVVSDHSDSSRANLIAVIGSIAMIAYGVHLASRGSFDDDAAAFAVLNAVLAVLMALACQAMISWGKLGIAVSVLGFGALTFFVSDSLFYSLDDNNDEPRGAPDAVIEQPPNDSERPPPPHRRTRPEPQPPGLEPPVPQPTAPQTSTGDDSSDTLPNYQWPPETPSWTYTILRGSDEGSISLYDISDRLYFALRAADYFESSYYRAPGGFVLVTRLEAIDSDGSPLHGGRRFQLPDDDRDFEFVEYIRNLFFAPTGYYRFIAFVVTDRPYVASSDVLSEASALARLQAGATALPPNFRDTPFSSNHRIDALIYEFRKAGTDADVEALRPGRVPPKSHLTRSGLYSALQENHL